MYSVVQLRVWQGIYSECHLHLNERESGKLIPMRSKVDKTGNIHSAEKTGMILVQKYIKEVVSYRLWPLQLVTAGRTKP